MGLTEVLVPSKFIFLITHLLASVVILTANEQNIYATFGYTIGLSTSDFKDAQRGIQAAAVLTIIILALELIFLFIGYTIFYDKLNIVQCVFHALGTIIYSWYNIEGWNWYVLWYMWAVFSLLPLIFELACIGVSALYYRKLST